MRKLVLLVAMVAAVVAVDTSAAKQSKPARVQASFDFVAVSGCGPGAWYGHIEIHAFDDEPTPDPAPDPEYRESDRISFKITWADGTTWTPDLIAVAVTGDTAAFAVGSWAGNIWTVHDGGNPGTALTGSYLWDIPETVDGAQFKGAGSTCTDSYFLTSGNIKVTSGS